MNIFKKIFSLMAVVILFGKCGVIGYVGAEEAPHDIKLTCETKYIDINEVPEDRVVPLSVSIDNNPGFLALSILMDIDSRLKYDDNKMCDIVTENDDIVCINYSFSSQKDHRISYDIMADENTFLRRNGTMMILKLRLPDVIQAGDIFNVDILPDDDYKHTVMYLDSETKIVYPSDHFSELNCGGIHITGDPPVQEPVPVQQNNVDHTDENPNNEQKPIDNTNSEVNDPKKSNEVTTITSSVTTSAVSSSQPAITTKPQTSAVTTVTTKKTEPVTVVTTEKYETNSNDKNTSKKGINLIWFIISAVTIIVIGGSVFIILKRSKKEK